MPARPHEPILAALDTIRGTGVFCATAAVPFFMPELIVEGVGEIAFPLTAAQTRELIRAAEAAPYGKGLNTVRDDKVRQCWQIDAAKLALESSEWQAYLKRTVRAAATDMGVDGEVSADLYKLLLYEKGGHFLPHRDTEKLDAMFGTLIIALPSAHAGGRLLVRHDGEEVAVDFSTPGGLRQFQSAALFADCEHEVEPVTRGVRCCLVYNLVLKEGDPSALNASLTRHAQRLVPLLKAMPWQTPAQPAAVLLEHRYTEANLSVRNLKGHDAARARALLTAAGEAGLAAYLALATLHQSGSLDTDDEYAYYRSGRGRHRTVDVTDGEMGEVYEESLTVEHWRDAADRPVALDTMPLDPEALISRQRIDEGAPDEKEAEGYTGNAGCTMDYWYRRAVVVLWPRARHAEVLVSTNFHGACRQLAALAAGESAAGRTEFRPLLKAVLSQLPAHVRDTSCLHHAHETLLTEKTDKLAEPLPQTLLAIAQAGTRGDLDLLLQSVPATALACCNAGLWKQLIHTFGADPFAAVVAALSGAPDQEYRLPLFLILDALTTGREATNTATMAARLAALPVTPAARSSHPGIAHSQPGGRAELLIMLRATPHLQSARTEATVTRFLKGDGSLEHVRRHLGPALIQWVESGGKPVPGSPPAAARDGAITLLSAEIAHPIVPFPDWSRPCPVPADTVAATGYGRVNPRLHDLLKELRTFMADPAATSHSFSYPADERSHLENWIARFRLDLDSETVRKGSPHKLLCTKNSASVNLARHVRAADITLLETLRQL